LTQAHSTWITLRTVTNVGFVPQAGVITLIMMKSPAVTATESPVFEPDASMSAPDQSALVVTAVSVVSFFLT
jgi:hypothetical protein